MNGKMISIGYNPGGFKLSKGKIKDLCKLLNLDNTSLKCIRKNTKFIKNSLQNGDIQMAKVISCDPLLIATYSDEMDGVLILKFPQELVEQYDLTIQTRLVSVNSYWPKEVFDITSDIISGKFCSYQFREIIPYIPLFLSDDVVRNLNWVSVFSEDHWKYFDQLIEEYLDKKPNCFRDGFRTLIKY